MRLVHGVHRPLEDAADKIINDAMRKITRPEDKSDILTPWKEQDRRRREIYVSGGVPDSANRSGNFHRSLNTKQAHLNSATPGSQIQHRNRVARGASS